ncbi:MAG: T9SS type A sorting domain-containing protein [Crocinitomicaceae bacterium]|nr:T9SS type A sorting domain-containing protein [Crocinitomicaceae bacterium]
MKNIDIPEPCSENWNEMSPTEKGAFCQKCAIDVYDFTNKSGDEIRDILTLNIGGRVCGRIEPKQLEELNDDFHAWKMNNKQSFNRAWVFTLLVVFGMTLFSCEEDEVPVVQKIQKTAQAFLSEVPELTERANAAINVGESNFDEQAVTTGQLHVATDQLVLPEPEIFEELILGEMEMVEEHREPIYEEAIRGQVKSVRHMLGGMSWSTEYIESLPLSNEPVGEVKMSGLVYPNPAKNQTTLKVTMPSKADAEIQLFSMNGQHLRSIHSGRMEEGESEFPIDLIDLDTGMYLVVVQSGKMKETIKFSKI